MAILAALYATVARELAWQWWDDPNYSHGFLVPAFAAFLVWRRRDALAALRAPGTWLGIPVLSAGIAMLVLGDLGAELFLTRSSLIVVLAGLVLFHFGFAALRLVAFALGY